MTTEKENGFAAFCMAPFRFVKAKWNKGPAEQWIMFIMVPTIVGYVVLLCFAAISCVNEVISHRRYLNQEAVMGEVKTGIVTYKYVTDQHRHMVGKMFVTVPARCHVVLRGKDNSGTTRERDIIVYPEDFEKMDEGSTQTFR